MYAADTEDEPAWKWRRVHAGGELDREEDGECTRARHELEVGA